ncbi:MAG: DUF4350 domain-containing protein [Flavobacteriales bacterium]|nr:DUF4350 domain-containing protein [Flavobacteriales bacterium]MCB9448997.1 DUF4350 domain-containing protein [Flavobacteriales bacterium]
MKRSSILAVVIAGVVVAVVVLFVLFIRQFTPKYQWHESYDDTANQPYATKVLHEWIKKDYTVRDVQNVTRDVDTSACNTSYVFIGYSYFTDSLATDRLLSYVNKGNDVFLATNTYPEEFLRHVFGDLPSDQILYSAERDTSIDIRFTDAAYRHEKSCRFTHLEISRPVYYDWNYIEFDDFTEFISESYPIEILGKFKNRQFVNFVRLPYGKGYIYLHTNPIIFTNYHLLTEDGFRYTERVLGYLKSDRIYWDRISHNPSDNSGDATNTTNPLRFLFSHRSLKTGWYMTCGLILLYLFFGSKRRQRVIPILPANNNASIEYAKAVGTLYFQQGSPKLMAEEIILLFNNYLRNRYRIDTKLERKPLVEQVATRSGLSVKDVDRIYKHLFAIRYGQSGTYVDDLSKLNQAIEHFYKNCK